MIITNVLQAGDGKWLHCFQQATEAISDDYRANWYVRDLEKTLRRLGFEPVGLLSVAPTSAGSTVVAGTCMLGTQSNVDLEEALAAFDRAAGFFAKLDHATKLNDIDELVDRLGKYLTSHAVAERLYLNQLDLYVGVLINWPSYEEDHLDYEVNRALEHMERKLHTLRRNFPEFSDKPLPNPFRRQ